MKRYYFELTDRSYNDLGAFIPDGYSKEVAVRQAKRWMAENSIVLATLIEQFVRKLAEHGNGIALLFNRCDSKMFQDVIFEKATGMKFLRHRIRFYRPDGTRGDSPGCGSILIAFGVENAEVLKNCSIEGKYVQLN